MTNRQALIDRIVSKYNAPPCEEELADRYFMGAALELAKAAAELGEVPVGCVIVRNGHILAADFNGREDTGNALYHAECAAIVKACKALGGWRLSDCTLYVTLEPCPMCAGAIWNARVPVMVVGAKDARAGSFGSLINLNAYPLNHKPRIRFGVLEKESTLLLRAFFGSRRSAKARAKEGASNEGNAAF